MNDIKNSIERLRKRLLDLSGRNKSISFKHSSKSKKQLRFVNISISDFYKKMLTNEKIEIVGLPVPDLEPNDEKTEQFQKILTKRKLTDVKYLEELGEFSEKNISLKKKNEIENKLRDRLRLEMNMSPVSRVRPKEEETAKKLGISIEFDLKSIKDSNKSMPLQTMYYEDDLNALLSGLIDERKLIESESGLVPMYLALGFLEWLESESTDKNFFSPLIFLPVDIERQFAEDKDKIKKEKYYISCDDTEVETNHALRERLKNDFSIILPDMENEQSDEAAFISPTEYFDKIARVIQNQANWQVLQWATVSFFSFSKLSMYQELKEENLVSLKALSSPLEDVIAGIQPVNDSASQSSEEDYAIDSPKYKNKAPYLISLADTSQVSAVMDAVDGKNLVVIGPPGTGKSQTITNMIAALMDAGKRILFVAEKKAALDVVRNRLNEAGLGAFCLDLHSGKAKKSEVLKSIKERTESETKANKHRLDMINQKIDEIKFTINSYLAFLNEPCEVLNCSYHDLLWKFLNLKHMHPELYKFVQKNSIDEYAKISNYDIESIETVLRNFSEKYKINIQPYGSVEKHPWHGVVAESIAPFEIALMYEELNDLKSKTEDIKSSLLFISSNFDSMNEKTEIIEFVRNFKENTNVYDEKFEWVSNALANKDYQHQELLNLLSNKINLKNQETDISQYVNNDGVSLTLEAFKSIENDEYLIINKSLSRSDLQQQKEQERTSIAELKTNYQIAINELNIKFNLRKEQLRADQSSKASEVKKLENSLTTVVNLLALKNVSFENVLDITENLMSICEQFPNDKIRYTATSLAQIETLKEIIYNHHQFQTKNGAVLDYLRVDSFNDIYHLKECCRELQRTSILRFFSSKYRRAKLRAKSILKSYESDILAQYKLEKIIKFNDNLGEIKNNILSYTINKQNLASVSLVELIESSKSWCNYFDNLQIIDFKHIDNISFKRKLLSISKSEMTTIVACLSDLIKSSIYSDFKLGKLTNLSIEGISLSIQEEYKILETKSNEDFAEEQGKLAAAYEGEKLRKDRINTSIDKLISFTSLIDFKNDIPLIKIAELKSLLEKIDLLKFKVKSHFLSEVVPKDIKNSEIIFIKMLDFIQKELRLSNKEIISIIDSDINLWMVSTLNRISTIEEAFERIKEISLNNSIFSSKFHDAGIHLDKFRDKIVAAINSEDKLNGYLDFCYASKELDKYESSLKRFVKFAKGDSAVVEALPEAFRMCLYYTHIKDRAGENSSFFSKPVESIFNEYRRQFQKYDDLLSDAYKVELHNKLLLQSGPSGVATGKRKDYTEMGLIDHQLKLSKPNISTRNLFSRAPQSIQKIKPVFLMSPLSVSQLLPSGKLFFDVVIMDEASQMRPEDSLGSIARSNQTIIVGDPKQMPPSNFFNTNDKQEDGDEEDYIDIPEQSVLDLAMNSFKTRQLKWHYRSRNEKLIAFSNRHFYNNSLTIFPKATHNHPSGVEYLNISGVYKDSTNEKEAYAIVDKAVELIQVNPNRSIMIATMNKKQNDLISQILHEREKNDPVLDQYIQKFSGTLEPLIVKNLENIQGDERDCVLISTVYGKDSNGSFFQRFGPINGKSGDRRLNVLFTRAKHYVLVLTSMDPDDIVLSSNEGGAYIFKNYLNYAKTGKLGTEIESFGDRPPDSDFELFVARKIKERLPSLEVVAQVGVAGFFIDLAIRHPQKPGAFLLGIECDGRAYHSSKSARDRDKIRQKILENLGWRIHRIWSTDWFSNAEQEMNKLVIVVEQAISNMSKDSFLEPLVEPNKNEVNKKNTVHTSNTKIPIEVDIKITSNNIVEQFNSLDKDLKWINNLNHNNIVESLKQEGLHVMDKRSVGGALWILGDVSLNEMMQLLRSKGFHFIFAENGGKTTNNKPSWYLKEKK